MATKNPRPPPKPAQGLPNGYVSKGGPESYDAHDNFQPTANYLSKDPKAFHVRVHVNNDKFEPGKKMTVQVNKVKTFENFLEECTEKMKPAFGAARRLYTARGRKRIQNLEELTEDSIYVITGNEPFKKHNYKEIPERQRPLPVRGFKKIDISRIYTPVQHALEERLRHKSGRSYYLNEHRRGLRLRVHVNGENERPYCPVSIRYKDRENFIKILEEIERTLQLQPIEKVYKVINQGGKSENFTEITDAEHLEQDEHVLVLPKNEKKLQADKIYHLDGKKNFRVGVSPRHGPAYNFPSFPDFDAGFKHNKSLNKHRPLPSIGSSQKGSEPISPFSNPPNSQGSRQRSKGRTPKQADYDQDAGGVYRAKKQNNAKGAAMVNETNDTHIERPIDQMEAEVVDEEDQSNEEAAAVKIQAGARGYMERKRFKQRKAEMEAEKQEEQQQQQRQQQGKADQKKNLSEDDAATIVQASFKGYKTRKDLNLKKQQGQK
ncbi:doublecortin domain-containing protein 2-like isoform X11 [Dreissena polymorpha]|uniref:doublecortin domain-containing protein 2-like isoform X11 n=1 Tax=Dreissena polymorpha TaxID=45954 RepID=UPI002263D8EF|nr:doublecortin domain-containing protein 2-like isoform X11 [Dreissena polymorpha]